MKITIQDLIKVYAGEVVLNDLSLEIIKGSKCAIVGENGSGKSTLLKIIAGLETHQVGSLIIPREMRVGYLQQVYPDSQDSARDYILSVFEKHRIYAKKLKELENAMAATEGSALEKVFDQFSRTLELFEREGGYDLENHLESYAKGLGVLDVLKQPFNTLSGGQKTRVALVQLLLKDIEVLCLDEPTNHLDTAGIEWLENHVSSSSKTCVIVSHDREFLKNTVSVFHELEEGQVVTYHGNYEVYRKARHERFLNLVKDFEEQNKQIQKLKLAIRRYRQWGNDSDNEDFYKRAKSLEKRLERIECLPKPKEISNRMDFKLQHTQTGSKEVVVVQDLVIGYDTPLTSPLNFTLLRKERFAIAAPNGKGKTTLIKTLLKEIEPLSGTVEWGPSVDVGYLPQTHHFVKPTERILAYTMRKCELDEERTRRHLARFGFYQADMYKAVKDLSGGERVRLKLLEIMIKGCNCIILDEPTNHLDIQSCEIIEQALIEYPGTVIIVSHDRMLLSRLVTRSFHLDPIA